jgi:NAD(P)-dependent dehydrogenase (short-subunit alcohol dehydrogenase family)
MNDTRAARNTVSATFRGDVLAGKVAPVNCAGIIRRGDEHRLDVFEGVLSVNLTGTMRCASLARPKLAAAAAQGGGAIVDTASVLSSRGRRCGAGRSRATSQARLFSFARPRRDS